MCECVCTICMLVHNKSLTWLYCIVISQEELYQIFHPMLPKNYWHSSPYYSTPNYTYSHLVSCPHPTQLMWAEGSGVISPNPWASSRSMEQRMKLQSSIHWNNSETRTGTSVLLYRSKWWLRFTIQHWPICNPTLTIITRFQHFHKPKDSGLRYQTLFLVTGLGLGTRLIPTRRPPNTPLNQPISHTPTALYPLTYIPPPPPPPTHSPHTCSPEPTNTFSSSSTPKSSSSSLLRLRTFTSISVTVWVQGGREEWWRVWRDQWVREGENVERRWETGVRTRCEEKMGDGSEDKMWGEDGRREWGQDGRREWGKGKRKSGREGRNKMGASIVQIEDQLSQWRGKEWEPREGKEDRDEEWDSEVNDKECKRGTM